ncbi:MAG: TIGR00725 family protein [Nocardiaceae bacterium]|nr:TIGR00725 family protein [Nocardiaceae bacterium]
MSDCVMSQHPPYLFISGPGEPRERTILDLAHEAGRTAGELGWFVLTGGLGGVMAAAASGVESVGGTAIALLPGRDRTVASRGHSVALPTGLGEMRNSLLVRCADAVLAIGESWGTLSEIALAARTGVPVVGIGVTPPSFAGPELILAADVSTAFKRLRASIAL